MQAMELREGSSALQACTREEPRPGPGEVLLRVTACGVCRTDLHILDRELLGSRVPLIPGHEIVGQVVAQGAGCHRFPEGVRVGVPWLGWTCGSCAYCKSGKENLCPKALFTGHTRDGGYAEFTVADEQFCFALPGKTPDAEVAPLLCAGLIGYRSLRKAGEAGVIGVYGFGAAAHILTQVARHEGRRVLAFTRRADLDAQRFATELGVAWAGSSDEESPEVLDAAIVFAPVGSLVVRALRAVRPGGVVVCGGIHMTDVPSFPYELLWGERTICSVANLTRRDGEEFLALAARVPVRTRVEVFPLAEANEALTRLREGRIRGAAVLVTGDSRD